MTEKRFTLIDMNNIEWKLISPIKDNGDDLTVKEVLDLLNELSENLTGCNKTAYNALETIKALNEENEKLKKQSIHFENEMYTYKGSEEYYKQLLIEKDEEIHHLKNALNTIKEIINEE